MAKRSTKWQVHEDPDGHWWVRKPMAIFGPLPSKEAAEREAKRRNEAKA